MAELMAIETKFEANGEEIKLTGNTVKNFLTRGNETVSEQEVVMFINLCKYQKLNPFLNEVYLVKFKGSPAQIIVSKEAFMKRANRSSEYDGFKAGIIVQRGTEILELEGSFCLREDELLGAWCDVYRKDRKLPITVKINFEEFNKGMSTWKAMPKTMIRKTAIVQALRETFPEDLGALYTEEEVLHQDIKQEVKEEIKELANTKPLNINKITNEKPKDKVVIEEATGEVIEGQIILDGPGF